MPEIDLPRRFESVAAACDHVERAVVALGWSDEDVSRVVLATGEAVGNAVEHGGGDLRLDYDSSSPERLTVCVRDGGPGPTPQQVAAASLPSPDAVGGRGLYILSRLTDAVRVEPDGALCLTFAVRP